MNINNLYKGQIIKNYKELCTILEIKPTTGATKIKQLEELCLYCNYHKEGNKFVIDNIIEQKYKKIESKIYLRGRKNFSNFKMTIEDESKYGIYAIVSNNDIYVGSTIKTFRKRFVRHNNQSNPIKETYDLLKNGADFIILLDMSSVIDEDLIREVETEYLNYFNLHKDWNLVNINKKAWSNYKKKNKPIKKVNIKIDSNKYKEAIQLLKLHDLL